MLEDGNLSGGELAVAPVTADHLESISLRCWPKNRRTLDALLARQGALGMAAWQGDRCVGQLHGYRIDLPQWDASVFPEWALGRMHLWPLGWPLLAAREAVESGALKLPGPVWGHGCFHVGYLRGADQPDVSLFGCGIGTALATASVAWARQQDCAAVLAMGGPADFFECLTWMGVLPWTTYARMGFRILAIEENGEKLPWWADGGASPEVVERARAMVARGRPIASLCFRAMLLEL